MTARLPPWLSGLWPSLLGRRQRWSGWLRQRRLPPVPGGLRLWITLISFGFLLAAVLGHGQQLQQQSLDRQGWLWLLLGVGVSLLSLVVNGLAWAVVLQQLGGRPRLAPVVTLHLLSNLRKYLPGGIWHLTARVQALRSGPAQGGPVAQPLSTASALLAVLLDPLLAAIAALVLVALGSWQEGWPLLGLLPLLALRPRWFRALLTALERRKARELHLDGEALERELASDLAADPVRRLPAPWWSLLALLAFVLVRFAGFGCCLAAFDLQHALAWHQWLAAFALAWTAGLVVPGAPGGLGVFEAVLLLRLGGSIAEAPLLAVVLSYRLVASLADLLAALTAQLDRRLDQTPLDQAPLDPGHLARDPAP